MTYNIVTSTLRAAFVGSIILIGASGCGPKPEAKSEPKGDSQSGSGLNEAEALARLRTVNDLKMLALALHNIASDNSSELPPVDGAGIESQFKGANDKRPMEFVGLSWRAMASKSIELQLRGPVDDATKNQLGAAFRGLREGHTNKDREPWDVPILRGVGLVALTCPIPEKIKEPWETYYRVFRGLGAAFEPGRRVKLTDFPDGQDKTILVVEAGEAVPWPKPEELNYDPTGPLPKLGGHFSDGFYAGFADGSVRFIKNGTDEKLIRAMITRNGGEAIPELPPAVDTKILRKAAGYKD